MDAPLKERVDRLGHILNGNDNGKSALFIAQWAEKMARGASRISKYRYRTRNTRLDATRYMITPYERVMDSLGPGFQEIAAFSRVNFIKALEQVIEATKSSPVCWDSKCVNPVTVVAHGLRVECCDGAVVTFICDVCKETLSLDLSDSEFNQQYSSNLTSMHKPDCYWYTNSVQLDLVYYINCNTIGFEIERIKSFLDQNGENSRFKSWELKFPVSSKVELLRDWFGKQYNLALIYVLLRGYVPLENEHQQDDGPLFLKCAGSFITSELGHVLDDPTFNGHPNWSSHYDQDRILNLTYETLIGNAHDSVQDRIHRLKKIISAW